MGHLSGSQAEPRIRFGDTSDVPGILACLTATATVAALPWMLGGVIPLARVVLICGALLSACLSLLSRVIQWRRQRAVTNQSPTSAVPLLLLPLLTLSTIGLAQLRPGSENAMHAMDHAIHAEDRQPRPTDLPGVATVSPAATRTAVGTLLAVSLLALVGFEHFRSLRILGLAAVVLLGSGLAVGGTGLVQLAQDSELAINQQWKLGISKAFGPFVNPNGAAGWLLMSFAISAGWLGWYLKAAAIDARSSLMHETLRNRLPRELHRFIANLSPSPVIILICFLVFFSAIGATFSRGGILALLASLTAALFLRASLKRLPLLLVITVVGAFGIILLLDWLRIRNDVVAEITSVAELESAAASRVQHWLNSLRAVMDFPLLGTGLGSYRYATLPYQDDYTGLWFINADNYFVEMIVEGGIVGLICYLSLSLCGIQSAYLLTGLPAEINAHRRRSRTTSSLRVAVGTIAVMMTVSQMVSGFFDFGVGLPPGLATFCLLLGVCSGIVRQTSPTFVHEWSQQATVNPMASGYFVCRAWVPIGITLCLMAGAGALLPDQLAAEQLHRSIVSGNRLLQQPITPEKLDRITTERSVLAERIRQRPDDPEALRLMTRLAAAQFRWDVMLQLSPQEMIRASNFHHRFQQLSVYQYARNMLAASDSQETQDAMIGVIEPALKAAAPQAAFGQAASRYPLMPGIARGQAELAALLGDVDTFRQEVRRLNFVEPHNARSAWFLGVLAADLGELQLAEQLWTRSVTLSRGFQAHILEAAEQVMEPDAAYQKFGPKTFDLCVVVALDGPGTTQRDRLLTEAEKR